MAPMVSSGLFCFLGTKIVTESLWGKIATFQFEILFPQIFYLAPPVFVLWVTFPNEN